MAVVPRLRSLDEQRAACCSFHRRDIHKRWARARSMDSEGSLRGSRVLQTQSLVLLSTREEKTSINVACKTSPGPHVPLVWHLFLTLFYALEVLDAVTYASEPLEQPRGSGDGSPLKRPCCVWLECIVLSPLLRLWILPTKHLKWFNQKFSFNSFLLGHVDALKSLVLGIKRFADFVCFPRLWPHLRHLNSWGTRRCPWHRCKRQTAGVWALSSLQGFSETVGLVED